MAFRSALARGAAGFGLVLLSIAPSACSSSRATTAPPQTANAATRGGSSDGAKPPATLSMIGTGETPSAPSPSPDALPALPSPAPAPPIPPSASPSPTADAAPAAPLPPLAVNINDELPFLATAAAPAHTTHSKAAADDDTNANKKKPHTKKLPPGPTGQHTSTRHGRKRGTSTRPYHPDPGIVVDITSAAAGANQAEVQKLARSKGYNPFRHCYEEGLRRNQHLAGKVSVEFTLGAEGAVVGAKKSASTLGDESVNQCVVREAAHLVLAKPDSGTPAIAMSVTLSPGDEPVPVPHAAPHADKLRDALRSKWSGVEVCYKQGLEKRRDLGGRMELKFKVKGSGEILESTEGDAKFGDATVTQCVLGVYKTAKLPKVTSSKKETTFVYAIHLESIPQAPTAAASPAPSAPTPVATTQP